MQKPMLWRSYLVDMSTCGRRCCAWTAVQSGLISPGVSNRLDSNLPMAQSSETNHDDLQDPASGSLVDVSETE